MRPGSSLSLCATSLTVSGMALLAAAPAWAAGSNMPWEQPLNQILQSAEGPVAKIIAVIIIIVTGLTLAFGDSSVVFQARYGINYGKRQRVVYPLNHLLRSEHKNAG